VSAAPHAIAGPGEPAHPADGSLRHVRAAIAFAFFNAMTWQVALGTPMVQFATSLGASAFSVGLAYSFVFLLTPVQVLSTSLLPRYGFKRMMLSGWGTRSMFLLPAVVLAWMAPAQGTPLQVAIFIGSVFLFTFFRSIGSCAWLPWMNSLLTSGNRGRYFATDQAVSGAAGVLTLILCAESMRLLPLYTAFLVQYIFAFVGSWFAYLALSRLPDVAKPAAMSLREVAVETPRILTGRGVFRTFLVIGVVAWVVAPAIPPYCAYFLQVETHVSLSQILWFTTFQYCGTIAAALFIRNRIDRLGAHPFFFAAGAIYAVVIVFWIGVLGGGGGGTPAMGASYVLLGSAAACWQSAINKHLPLVVDPARRTLAYSVHGAATSLVSGIAVALWGLAIRGASGVPSVNSGGFQVFFLVGLASMVVVVLLVSHLPAGAGTGRPVLLGGVLLRPFRGLTYLASLVLPGDEPEPASPTEARPRDETSDRT
jgi:hypothetical protein